ncbi:MAG: GAF domain-containing protein [Anaerolineae bacterium]
MDHDLLEHILDASRRMAETRTLGPLLDYIVDKAIELTGAERGYIVQARPDGSLDFLVTRAQDGQVPKDAEDQVSRSILRQVADSGEPLVLRDAAQDPRFGAADSVVILGLRSVMCVPLISQGETRGAIYVENRSIRGRFCDDDVIPLVLLANQAAVAIENARLFQSLQQSHDELEMRVKTRTRELSAANALLRREIAEREKVQDLLRAQRDLGLAVSAAQRQEDTLRLCVETAIRVSGMDCGGIYLVDRDSGCLDLAFHMGLPAGFVKDAAHYEADSAHALLIKAGKPIYGQYPQVGKGHKRPAASEDLRATAVVPVCYKKEAIACLNVASHTLDQVPENARTILESIASQIGSAIAGSQAKDALDQSQTNLQAMFDSLQDFLFVLDMEGQILDINPVVSKRLGYSKAELIGESVLQVHPPEKREEAAAIVTEMIAGKTDSCPVPVMARDGTKIPVETKITKGHWGGREALFGISRDVTERQMAEQALRQERDRAQRYLDIAGVIILALDVQGNISLINRKGCDVLACSKEKAINQNWFDSFLPKRVKDEAKDVFARLMAGDVAPFEHIESSVLTTCGQEKIIRWHNSVLSDQAGNRIGTLSSGEDITERKEAEEAIRRRNRELAEFNAIIGTLTSTLALEEVLQHIVTAAPRFFPYAVDATIQLLDENGALFTWVASDRIDARETNIVFPPGNGIAWIALREGRPFNVADVTVDPDFYHGAVSPAFRSLLVVPLISRDQSLGTLSITAPQIGTFNERDEQLMLGLGRYAAVAVQNAHWYEQTRHDAEAKTILLREVNHRVKNNLTGIIGLLQTERRYAPPEGRPAVQAAMDRIIQRISGLAQVHDMLSQSGWAPVLVSELANRITSTALNALPIDRQVYIAISPSPVKVSPAQANNLALVLNELVTNTFKHVESGGEATSITIQITTDNSTVSIEYRDSGPGYPQEIIDREYKGVGLYLVHNLVCHALHGSLDLINDGGAVAAIRFETEERSAT